VKLLRNMVKVELGKGRGSSDTINIFGVNYCPPCCEYGGEGNNQFQCVKYNGDSVVIIKGGVRKSTLSDFKRTAPCLSGKK
jgi:hypothetical protein